MEPEIIQEVKDYLAKNGIKPQRLAEIAGINPSILSRLLNEKHSLSLKNYRKIMAVIRKF